MTARLDTYLAYVRRISSGARFDLSRSGMQARSDLSGEPIASPASLPEAGDAAVQTLGASGAAFLGLLMTALGRRRTVAFETPCYPVFASIAEALGLETILMHHRPVAGVLLDNVRDAIGSGAQVVCLMDPHNPSAFEMGADERTEIVALCLEAGVDLLVDRVFADFSDAPIAYEGTPSVMIARSYSKSLGVGADRFGWLSVPEHQRARLAVAIDVLQGQPREFDETASLRLRQLAASQLLANVDVVRANNATLRAWLDEHPSIDVETEPRGMPYVSLRLPENVGAMRLALELKDEWSTAVVPGELFGLPPRYLRVGLTSDALAEGLNRLSEALSRSGSSPSPRQ